METYKIILKPIFFILLLLTVSFGCKKKSDDELLTTVRGKTQGKFLGKSNEFFPLQINNSWDYLIVKYDTLGKITDSNIFTITIKNQMVLTKTKDTFYNFDGYYLKNKDKSSVIGLDTGNIMYTRIKTGMSNLEALGSLAVWEKNSDYNYSYVSYNFTLIPGLFIKYDRPCTKIQRSVKSNSGKLNRFVDEYFEAGKGFVAMDVYAPKNAKDTNSHFYLVSRLELKGYDLK